VLLDHGPAEGADPSTVVDGTREPLVLLRTGPVPVSTLRELAEVVDPVDPVEPVEPVDPVEEGLDR
jgi:hypothetical protein